MGREHTEEAWQHLAEEIIRRGYARKQPERFEALAVTPLGEEVLFKGRKVSLAALPGPAHPAGARSAAAGLGDRPKPQGPSDSVRYSLGLFRSGKTLPEVAAERGLVLSTIQNHIAEAMEAGEAVDANVILGPERRATIEAVLRRLGPGPLKPVRDALGEAYSYNEIRLVRAAMEPLRS